MQQEPCYKEGIDLLRVQAPRSVSFLMVDQGCIGISLQFLDKTRKHTGVCADYPKPLCCAGSWVLYLSFRVFYGLNPASIIRTCGYARYNLSRHMQLLIQNIFLAFFLCFPWKSARYLSLGHKSRTDQICIRWDFYLLIGLCRGLAVTTRACLAGS